MTEQLQVGNRVFITASDADEYTASEGTLTRVGTYSVDVLLDGDKQPEPFQPVEVKKQ